MSKKGKKKWKPVELTQVLNETRPVGAWADEVEIDERELQLAAARKSVLPTAPRSSRGSDDERVPHSPPFVAYITNIPFEMIEEDVFEFFEDLQIDNVRLPRNESTGKLRGYGYVEFTERSGLIEALQISDKSMKGRRIRIDVSENNDRDRGYGRSDRMGRDRMGMGMGRDEDPDRALGDWRSGPRSEPAGEDRGRSGGHGFGGGGFGDREGRDRDGGGFGAPRESDNREGGWRDGMGSGTSDRFSDRDRDRDSFRSRGFGDRDRDGFDRDRGSRFGDRESYGDRPRYGDRDRGDRDRDGFADRPRFGDREREDDRERFPQREDGPPSESSEQRSRPKLNLQPRTRPIENPLPPPEEAKEKEKPSEAPAPAPAPPVPRASIFGAAKPVDTAAREREIEERLARERERAPRRDDGERNTEAPRSKESSEHGDEAHPSKKAEPAPPPKENAWSRRPRIEPNSNNGDASQNTEGSERRATSPGSCEDSRDKQSSSEPGRQNSRQDEYNNRSRNYGHSKERSDRDGSEGKRVDLKDSGDSRTGRSGSQDKREASHQDRDNARNKDESSTYDRYERKGARGRGGPHGRGMGHTRVDRGGGVGNKGRQLSDRISRKEKDHSNEDQPRLPKYEEKQIPNFVASNKYAFLNEDEPED